MTFLTKSTKIFFALGLLTTALRIGETASAQTVSAVPKEYYPNYTIEMDWQKIQETFVQIEAAQKIWSSISSDLFRELSTRFKKVFSSFPQDYNFQVVYEQCSKISETLGNSYSDTVFYGFMANCYKPINQIISKINSQYTIKVSATRNPAAWSAPLTVTFDARASKDPSTETIPTNNFYRYYRDTKGVDRVIGKGNVINYPFEEAGNYMVHLTVRSSNYLTKGILDGETTINVNVAPKAATIVVYANLKKLDKNKAIKIWTQEAQKGVILDGSATMPTGWRKIQGYKWEISSRDGFKYSKEGNGSPTYINVPFNWNGEYLVKLSTSDNENNVVSETFSITVSDPVAIIKQTPAQGNTSTTFSFDSNTSYSLTSRLKLYTWEIFDSNGDKTDTFQGKSIKKQFTKPGNYLVKLTLEDELGQTNVDTQEIYVESTPPIPQFTIIPTNKRTKASEFHLDANATLDIDVTNKNDSLEYRREFSNPNVATIISTEDNDRKVVVQFNEVGKHTIKLTVTDMYGKVASIEKPVEVTSILRPELTVNPNAITRGRNISFSVKTNLPIINYQWSFGDGDTRANQSSALQHIYQKIWIYNVTVTVADTDGNNNSITEKVFIGETGFPIAAFRIKNSNGFFLQRSEGACEVTEEGKTNSYDAYVVDRYQNITIDPSLSVNSKGTSASLRFDFQPRYDEVYTQNTFTHRFSDVGCQYIDLYVSDSSIGKKDNQRIWFKVNNALPTLKNLVHSFPQYGNESWIWFQENNVQNILDPGTDSNSSLIVKVTATNAVDPDGMIAYFKWYYYPKDNPNKILETRITPSNIPYTFFTLPRVAGEYMFGVTMYDNDDGFQKSENIIGNGPTIFFPQSNNNPDIPIVTLRSDKQTVNIGDAVTFDVIAKITSENEDFYTDRTIQYDFDGDGEWDLITRKDRVTYTYTKAMEKGYLPKAAVIYRGYKGIWEGNIVIVKNGVKPILTYNSIKNLVIFRDLSMGNIMYRQLCFDKKECAAGNTQYRKTHLVAATDVVREGESTAITQNSVFLQKYPALWTYDVSIQLKSNQGIEVKNDYQVKTTNNTNNGKITAGVNLITIPETSFINSTPEIYVSKSMHNSVLFYLHYEYEGVCFIDTDISKDSSGDGKSDNDQDIPCNTLQLWKYDPQFESIIGRVWFENAGKLVYKTFSVDFEGFDVVMDQNNLLIYQDITTLMNGIEEGSIGNADLKKLLNDLRTNLLDKIQTTNNVVQLQNHIKESSIFIDQGQKESLESIIMRLSNGDTVSALGGNAYETAREEILTTLPDNLRTEVASRFAQFELSAEHLDNEAKRVKLNEILNYIRNNAVAYKMDPNDISGIILKEFCTILTYYEIQSSSCVTDGAMPTPPNIPVEKVSSGGGLPTWLKVILRIIGGGIVVVGGVIVFFAVKAKLRANEEAVEDGDEGE